jgi:hypothetical protein
MTVLFTPITILINDGVKPRRGFSADPAGMITTTDVGAVPCKLKGLKPEITRTTAAQIIRIKASSARAFLRFFLFLGSRLASSH